MVVASAHLAVALEEQVSLHWDPSLSSVVYECMSVCVCFPHVDVSERHKSVEYCKLTSLKTQQVFFFFF